MATIIFYTTLKTKLIVLIKLENKAASPSRLVQLFSSSVKHQGQPLALTLTCARPTGCFFWTFIHDLKSVQALHGFFLTSPVCSCSLPVRSSGGLPATENGKPSKPVGSAVCDPLCPVGAAMFPYYPITIIDL